MQFFIQQISAARVISAIEQQARADDEQLVELYKVVNNLAPKIMHFVFQTKSNLNYPRENIFKTSNVRTVSWGTESLSFLGPKIWSIIPSELKKLPFSQFKSKIRLFKYLFLYGSNIATNFYRDFKVRSYSTETLLSNSGCGDKILRKPCFCRVFLNSESCKSSCRENSHLYLRHVLQSIANTSNTVT